MDKRAIGVALRALEKQARFSLAIKRILQRREFPQKVIDEVINFCKEHGYLNDRLLAESVARVRTQKGYGRTRILQEIRQKSGLPLHELEEIIIIDEEPQEEALLKLLNGRYARKDLSDYKERQKVIAALMRRGYTYSLIHEAISKRALHE